MAARRTRPHSEPCLFQQQKQCCCFFVFFLQIGLIKIARSTEWALGLKAPVDTHWPFQSGRSAHVVYGFDTGHWGSAWSRWSNSWPCCQIWYHQYSSPISNIPVFATSSMLKASPLVEHCRSTLQRNAGVPLVAQRWRSAKTPTILTAYISSLYS